MTVFADLCKIASIKPHPGQEDMMDSGLEFVELGTNDTNVVGISATGKLTADDITKLVDRLESIQASGSKARVYIDLTGYEGYDLSLVKEKFAHLSTFWKSIECCAYVVDKAWMSTAIGLIDAVTPMHLRAFSSDQDAEARAWVLSESNTSA